PMNLFPGPPLVAGSLLRVAGRTSAPAGGLAMMEEREIDDAAEDRDEVVIQRPAGMLGNAPWWLVSVGIHAVLILGATLVAIEKYIEIDRGEVTVFLPGRSAPVIQEIERKRDVFERKGIPKDDQQTMPTEEPAIFFPTAEIGDHNESNDNEEYQQMKGQSKDYLSYTHGDAGGIRGRQLGKAAGIYDSVGVGNGGGSAGRYGGRFGGKKDMVARGGGTTGTESAVIAALRWLARHQGP